MCIKVLILQSIRQSSGLQTWYQLIREPVGKAENGSAGQGPFKLSGVITVWLAELEDGLALLDSLVLPETLRHRAV